MKILMVCLGNICRSPLAEGILKDLANSENLDWQIDSAGTSNWHEGNPPHKGSIEIALENGINIKQQRARQFRKSDFDEYDLILVMDSQNYQDVIKISESNTQKEKVKIMLNFAHPNSNMGVPDPYYTGDFQEVYNLLHLACTNILKQYSI